MRGEARIKSRYIGYGSVGLGARDWYTVECNECRAKSDEYGAGLEAIAAWNRRADHIRDTTKKVSNADRIRGMTDEELDKGGHMTNLITEARELCEKWSLSDYAVFECEDCIANMVIYKVAELCDALEEEQKQKKQLLQELCKLACESVEREKTLARIEAEVVARLEEHHEDD